VLSRDAGVYCWSSSAAELVKLTVSARQAGLTGCSVPLKPGMRPAPVVEDVEVAEAGKEEEQNMEETATAQQPVYVITTTGECLTDVMSLVDTFDKDTCQELLSRFHPC